MFVKENPDRKKTKKNKHEIRGNSTPSPKWYSIKTGCACQLKKGSHDFHEAVLGLGRKRIFKPDSHCVRKSDNFAKSFSFELRRTIRL